MAQTFVCQNDFTLLGDNLGVNAYPEAGRPFHLQYSTSLDINAMFADYTYENTTDTVDGVEGGTEIHASALALGVTNRDTLMAKFTEIFSAPADTSLAGLTLTDVDGIQASVPEGSTAANPTNGPGLQRKTEEKIMKDVAGVAFFSAWSAQNFTPASVTTARTGRPTPLWTSIDTNIRTPVGPENGLNEAEDDVGETGSWIAQILREAHTGVDGSPQIGESEHDIVGRTISTTSLNPPMVDDTQPSQTDHKYKLRLMPEDVMYFRFRVDCSGNVISSASGTNKTVPRLPTVLVSLKLTHQLPAP